MVVLADASVGRLKSFLFSFISVPFFILLWIERQTEIWREWSCIHETILEVRYGIPDKYWRCDKKNMGWNQLYKEFIFTCAHKSILCHSQKLDTTYMPVNRIMKKEICYIYTLEYYSTVKTITSWNLHPNGECPWK